MGSIIGGTMKEYTFQAAMSQCKVNKINFINKHGDIMYYHSGRIAIWTKRCVRLVYLDGGWYEYKEEL